MKNKIIVIITLIIILIPSCYFTFKYFTEKKEPPKLPDTTPIQKEPPITEEYKGAFSNKSLIFDTAIATQPLMNAYISYFGNADLLKSFENKYTNAETSFNRLLKGEADFILTKELSEEMLKQAEEAKIELEITPVINEALVILVNKNNPIKNLTIEEIRDIYSGKITNWNALGGNEQEISIFSNTNNSISQKGFNSLIMEETPPIPPQTTSKISNIGEIITAVANYDNKENSIGYTYYHYTNTIYNSPNLKLLNINGIKPTPEEIATKNYPLITTYYIVINKNGSRDAINLRDAIISEEGKRITREALYVPAEEE